MAHQPDYDPVRHRTADDPALRPATAPPATSSTYDEDVSSEQIRRDIRRTRRDMDETVDALQERLRPRHLIDDVLEMFRSWGGGSSGEGSVAGVKETFKDAGSTIVHKLKQHPMPAALIGAGLVWMLLEGDDDGHPLRRRGAGRGDFGGARNLPEYSGSYVDARTGRPYDIESYGEGFGGATEHGGQPSMTERAKQGVSGAAETVKDAARSAGETIASWTEAARDSAGSAAGAARNYASGASHHVSHQVARGYETGRHYVERGLEEYPLAMGAAALAVGVLTGLCLPRTRVEDRYMGDAADEVKDRAREVGQDAVERGKGVARNAAQAASAEAQRQGATPGELAEKVKRVAQDVKEAASESARREGIDPQSLKHKGQEVADRAKESAREDLRMEKERFDA